VQLMTELYHASMTPEVFAWEAASNNRALVAAGESRPVGKRAGHSAE